MSALLLTELSPAIGVLVHILIVVVVLGLIAFVVWWAINAIPLPSPFAEIARVCVILVFLLVLIHLLLPLLSLA